MQCRGPNIGLIGYGIRVKLKAEYRTTGLLLTGCRMLMLWVGCGTVLKLMAGCRMENGKSHITDIMPRAVTLSRREQDGRIEPN